MKSDFIQNKFNNLCITQSDINEHLPTLYKYASECESVLELGVRGCVSSWAFACGLLHNNKNVKSLILNDINACDINELLFYTQDIIEVQYRWINDLDLQVTTDVDLTFIDTWHVYAQLKMELEKFSKITKKYIIMHDTTLDGIFGETIRCNWNAEEQSKNTGFSIDDINCGLQKAISEFLTINLDWKLHKEYTNNNGLTILERI